MIFTQMGRSRARLLHTDIHEMLARSRESHLDAIMRVATAGWSRNFA